MIRIDQRWMRLMEERRRREEVKDEEGEAVSCWGSYTPP
jgi:hypothetical protein